MAKSIKKPTADTQEAPLYEKEAEITAEAAMAAPTVPETPAKTAVKRLKRLSMAYTPYQEPVAQAQNQGIIQRLFIRRKPRATAKSPNSLIIRYQEGHYAGTYEYVPDPIGLPFDVEGWLFLFTCHTVVDSDGNEVQELRPLAPDDAIKVLPESLFRKLHKWQPYHKLVSESLRKTLIEKLKIGLALGFFGISAFILFMIVISLAGS
jgi:hypothetical protein